MKAYPITILCRVMMVSRSGFYAYLHRYNNGTDEDPKEAALAARIHAIFKEHRGKYGSRRILKQLEKEGYKVGRYKVRRIMKDLGLKANSSRKFKVTTDSRHSFPVALNVLNRDFEVTVPNKVWTADITYIWTLEGWLYLAIIMDLFSRQIIGWAMDERMKKQLALAALAMAYFRRRPRVCYS
jgi:transposase InsO family protein